MDTAVKPALGRRARKALETRRRVLDAAEALFLEDGYTASTMTAIAERADVAVQTLYAVFGSKGAILMELIDAHIVGDDHAGRLQDRDDWRAMERETDPVRQTALFATIAARIGEGNAAISEVLAAAAGTDPEIAGIYERQRRSRYRDQRRLARSLAAKHALRAGVSEAQAADTIWAIANIRTYRALVGERRWSKDEYEQWLADLLARALLDSPDSGRGSRDQNIS